MKNFGRPFAYGWKLLKTILATFVNLIKHYPRRIVDVTIAIVLCALFGFMLITWSDVLSVWTIRWSVLQWLETKQRAFSVQIRKHYQIEKKKKDQGNDSV